MECSVCVVRSSVGYCSECQALLCEECGLKCEECGKMVCPEHKHETRSGRTICLACDRERKKRRAARGGAATPPPSKGDAPAGGTALDELEEEADEEALVESARKGVEPWLMSLYIAGAGLVLLIAFYLLGVRTVGPVHISLYMMILPLFALLWAGIGFIRDFEPRSFIGAGVAILTCIVAVVMYVQDPDRIREQQVVEQSQQTEGMTPEERQQMRDEILQRFQPQ